MADLLQIVVQADDQASAPLNQIATGALRSLGDMAVEAAAKAGQAILGFGADSIKLAGDFEAGMNTFKAAAGDSLAAAGLSVDDFRDKFLQLGAELPVSTSAVQEAATTLVKGGLDPLVVKMGGLESSLKFAAAAGMDLGAAAELSIKQLGTFVPITASAADQTAFLADAQDLLVKAAGASTLDVDKLGDAMLGAGGAAKATGVDYQDFVTTMGLISPGFQSAATAGTSYKNFLTRLIPQTSDATGWMQKLGLYTSETGSKFFDATGKFVGNRQAADLLSKAFSGLSDAERSEAAAMIFGNDAKDAAIALAASGAAGYDKFADAMAKASGVEATAQTVQQGFNIALDNMHGSVEALQIVVGTALLPALTFFLNSVISPGINLVTAFAQAMLGSSDAFASLSGVLQVVVTFFGDLWAAGTSLITAFNEGGTLSMQFAAALEQLGMALGLPFGLLSSLSFAVQGFIATIWPAADAIGAFIIGAGDLSTVASALTALFGPTIGGLITQAIAVLDNYATVWIDLGTTIYNVVAALLGGDLAGAWAALTSGIAQVVADYQVYAASLGQLISDLGTTIITAVVTYAPILAQQFLTWGQALVDWVTPYIPIVLETLNTWIAGIWTWIQTQAPIWLTELATWGAALVDWATPYLALAVQTLGTWVAGLWAWVQQQAPGWLTQLASWGAALAEWVAPAIPPMLAAIGGLATSLFAWVSGQAGALLASFGAWAQSILEWIPGATVQFLAQWPQMLSSFLDWIATAAGPILLKLGDWALSFIGWVVPMIPDFVVALAGILAALVTFIAETAGVLVGKLLEWGPPFYDWVHQKAIPALLDALAGMGKSIVGWIGSAVSTLAGEAGKLGKGIIDGIVSGVTSGASALTDKLKNLAKGALDAAKNILGIHSPSTVFAAGVGEQIPAGIALGVEKATPKATAALGNMAGALAKLVSDGVGAFGALASVGAIPQGAVQRFGDSLLAVVAMFDDLNKRTRGMLMASAMQITGGANKLFETLKLGVDAFAKLSTLGDVPPEAARIFADALLGVIVQLDAVNTQTRGPLMASAMQITGGATKIVDVLGKGVDAFAKLSAMGPITADQVLGFGLALGLMVGIFATIAQQFAGSAVAFAAQFAESAGKILAVVGSGVDALSKLKDLTSPPAGSILLFAQLVGFVVLRMGQIAQQTSTLILGAAVRFGESAGKVLTVVKDGVDAIAKLGDLAAPPAGSIKLFAELVGYVVLRLAQAGNQFSAGAVAAAARFAEGAGKSIEIVGKAVDAFAKLPSLVAPAPGAVKVLADGLLLVVGLLWFSAHQIDQGALAAVVAFSEGAGKVVGIISGAVDAFTKLPSIIAPTPEQVRLLSDGLLLVVGMLWFAAHQIDQDALAAVVAFSEGAGKVVGVLKAGVDGFAALPDLQPVAEGSIQIFVAMINRLMIDLGAAASSFSAEAIAQAAKFADAAGKAVGILKNGVDGLLTVDTFTGVSEAAITRFADGVRLAVAAMARLAGEFGPDLTAAANTFAKAAGESTDFLKKGVEGFNKLKDLDGVPQAGLKVFEDAVIALVQTAIRLGGVISNDMLAEATRVANGADQVIEVVKNTIKAFLTLGTATAQIPAFITNFVTAVTSLMTDFQHAVLPPTIGIGANIALGIADGITAGTPAIVTAVYAAVNAALAAARSALGIASPSKAFAALGQFSGAGLVEGLDASTAAVSGAAANLAGSAAMGAQGAIGGGIAPTRPSAPASSSSTTILQIAPGAVVVNAAAGQREVDVADLAVQKLQTLVRGRLP